MWKKYQLARSTEDVDPAYAKAGSPSVVRGDLLQRADTQGRGSEPHPPVW
ncbi:hypothetical protein ACFXKG_20740 [Streptomyces sp. NPDC059255]